MQARMHTQVCSCVCTSSHWCTHPPVRKTLTQIQPFSWRQGYSIQCHKLYIVCVLCLGDGEKISSWKRGWLTCTGKNRRRKSRRSVYLNYYSTNISLQLICTWNGELMQSQRKSIKQELTYLYACLSPYSRLHNTAHKGQLMILILILSCLISVQRKELYFILLQLRHV